MIFLRFEKLEKLKREYWRTPMVVLANVFAHLHVCARRGKKLPPKTKKNVRQKIICLFLFENNNWQLSGQKSKIQYSLILYGIVWFNNIYNGKTTFYQILFLLKKYYYHLFARIHINKYCFTKLQNYINNHQTSYIVRHSCSKNIIAVMSTIQQ